MSSLRPASALVAPDTDTTSNRLLAALTDADPHRWRPHLEYVALRHGQVLCYPGQLPRYAYFPTSAVTSMMYVDADGASTGIAVVGNEGVVGLSILLGGGSTHTTSVVLIAGHGFRIGAKMLRGEFDRSDAVRQPFLRYTQALANQIGQSALCHRHHNVDQQVCAWLLDCLVRRRGSELLVTQEVLSSMLGVRRESVSQAAGRLRDAGIIRYTRGHIVVLDHAALEHRTCECHAAVRREYDRMFPAAPLARPHDPSRLTSTAYDSATLESRRSGQEVEATTGP